MPVVCAWSSRHRRLGAKLGDGDKSDDVAVTDETSHKQRQMPSVRAAGTVMAVTERNPDGKGVTQFLRDWDYSAPRGVVAKPRGRILADYFTSLLVLAATFTFKPVFGKDYYLYFEAGRWTLSLIGPQEWRNADKQRAFVGICQLHDDSTWSIEPSENLSSDGPVAEAVGNFFDGFADKLKTSDPLEDGLPVAEFRLPYYQRLFAAALSRSLKRSLAYGEQQEIPAVEWLASMPNSVRRLVDRSG